LLPLVPLYAAVTATKNWLVDRGVLPQRRLLHPVISVGSISAGGAGKTPMVILLAELLQRRGFKVRILTRGYRRNGTAIFRVNPDGGAREFGDEPLLMARRLKSASVWVGIDRHRVGRVSEKEDLPGSKVIYLLDDGFQHRKLVRDLDIALITRQDLEDTLLPAGNLREPLKALRRADMVVVREDEAEVAALLGVRDAWVIRRRLEFPKGVALPRRPVAFCGLARPEGFLSMLAAEGIVPVAFETFRDHHPYSDQDVDRLVEMARASKADGYLTTEKDAVKLTPAMIELLEAVGPVVAPQLRVELADEEARMEELREMMTAGSSESH
jgi:tetraacyldisaccharide 4'-kinase